MLINITHQHSLCCNQTLFLTIIFKNLCCNLRYEFRYYVFLSVTFFSAQKQQLAIFGFITVSKYLNSNSVTYTLSLVFMTTILYPKSCIVLMY